MNAKQIIQTLMTKHEIRNRDLASTIGISSAALTDRLNAKKSNNMMVSTMVELLTAISLQDHTTYTLTVVGTDGSSYPVTLMTVDELDEMLDGGKK